MPISPEAKINDKSHNKLDIRECKLKAGLYIVATPIGNLGDITLRALETLKNADIIICEDTRMTNKLLSHYGIKAKMFVYNDNNGAKTRAKITEAIEGGQSVALVSDAGTPLISDPGYKLVNEAYEHNLYVTTLPGASSVICALTLAGLPTNRFIFEGFLPSKQQARIKILQDLKFIDASLIFFERASRVSQLLPDILETLGDRDVAIVREISKSFEETLKKSVTQLMAYYADNPPPKGEVVIIIDTPNIITPSEVEIDDMLGKAMSEMKMKEAVSLVAGQLDLPKKMLYTRALELKNVTK